MARRKLSVTLAGVTLSNVDKRIILRAVRDEPPQLQLTYGDMPFCDGQRLLARRRVNRRITVEFAVRELYNLSERRKVVAAVNAWAKDGWMRTGSRPNQRIYVVVAGYASIQDPRDYNENFTVEFDAPVSPYWEDAEPQTLALSGTSRSGTLAIPGTAPTVVEATVKASGGTLQTLTLTVGDGSIELASVNMAQNNTLTLDHDNNGFLRIRIGGTSRMSKRTAASADDLFTNPGDIAVSFKANVACTVTFKAKGRYV